MNAYLKTLILLICIFSAFSAQASYFIYSHFQFGYVKTDTERQTTKVSGDALNASGSFSITNDIFVTMLYQSGNIESDVSSNLFAFGAGFHTALAKKTDLVLSARFLDSDIDANSLNIKDDTGYDLTAGLRFASNPNFELNIFTTHTNLYDDTANAVGVGTRIKFGSDRSFGVQYTRGDDTTDLEFSFRMNL